MKKAASSLNKFLLSLARLGTSGLNLDLGDPYIGWCFEASSLRISADKMLWYVGRMFPGILGGWVIVPPDTVELERRR